MKICDSISGTAPKRGLYVPEILACRRHAGRTRVLARRKRHEGNCRKKGGRK